VDRGQANQKTRWLVHHQVLQRDHHKIRCSPQHHH
jgi:hypothetical protein